MKKTLAVKYFAPEEHLGAHRESAGYRTCSHWVEHEHIYNFELGGAIFVARQVAP